MSLLVVSLAHAINAYGKPLLLGGANPNAEERERSKSQCLLTQWLPTAIRIPHPILS